MDSFEEMDEALDFLVRKLRELTKVAVFDILSDEEGISGEAYFSLLELVEYTAPDVAEMMKSKVDATDERFYLPEGEDLNG